MAPAVPKLLTEEKRRAFEAYVAEIWRAGTESRMLEHLDNLSVPDPYRLSLRLVYSRHDPLRVLDGLVSRGAASRIHGSTLCFSVVVPDRSGSTEVSFALISGEAGSQTCRARSLVAVTTRQQWTGLLRWISRQYPRLVPIKFAQLDLVRLTRAICSSTGSGYDVMVKEYSAHEDLPDKSIRSSKSLREWTSEPLDGVLSRAAERHQQIRSIRLAFFPRLGEHTHPVPHAVCKVTTEGQVEVAGRFGVAYSRVLSQAVALGAAKLLTLSDRGLRDRDYRPAPILLRYDAPLFSDSGEVRRLVATLRRYPHSMHAVQHGNPYAHVHVTDGHDGSSFDVWAVSPDLVTIVPRLKATEAALSRLIHFVGIEFAEGEVVDCSGQAGATGRGPSPD